MLRREPVLIESTSGSQKERSGMSDRNEAVQELFIEELEEVTGGSSNKIVEWVREQLLTTYACGEEGPDC